MKPINNFRDHRALKYNEQLIIFVIPHSTESEMYLLSSKDVRKILPLSIQHTNIGEPYRELVQFNFVKGEEEDYIRIDPNDLQDLVNMLSSIGLNLLIPDRLCGYLDFCEDND